MKRKPGLRERRSLTVLDMDASEALAKAVDWVIGFGGTFTRPDQTWGAVVGPMRDDGEWLLPMPFAPFAEKEELFLYEATVWGHLARSKATAAGMVISADELPEMDRDFGLANEAVTAFGIAADRALMQVALVRRSELGPPQITEWNREIEILSGQFQWVDLVRACVAGGDEDDVYPPVRREDLPF